MKKDIPQLKVEDLAITIVPSEHGIEDDMWEVHIINLKEEIIENVFITSRGYGEIDGEQRSTSTLRHFIEAIGPLQTQMIEPIQSSLFHLTHEYWVSFNFEGELYDKKYIFVPGSVAEINFTRIPFIERKGIMIR